MEVSLTEMLEAREKRAWQQRELLRRGRTMICFTMNIAGPIKNSPLIGSGYDLGKRLLLGQLDVAGVAVSDFEEVREKTGNECILLVDAEPLTVKAITAELEDHAPIGRLFDMDVLRPDGSKVERQELGLPGRKCLLCGESAQVCARSRKHSVAELQAKTREILQEAVDEWDSREAARLACQALLYEVAITPKPGLVDRENSGSHRDMDFFTFQASAAALQPYFAQCVRIGRQGGAPEETLRALRLPGKLAEAEMRRATVGVNTHKGAIFSMGILCGALGRLDRESWGNPDRILDECAAMAKGIVSEDYRDLTPETAKTAGQKLYLRYGITGVRGQAEAGFPAVREAGLPTLEAALAAGKNINEASCAALLALLVHTADTNMIHRGGFDGMQQATLEVREILDRENFPSRETLESLDKRFIEKNLSPGGSADLLALTLFLHFLRETAHMSEFCN
ncbi:MAG: triphosphoribosyl-dephospho-CoA synthase CitG [Candidatus Faecousia sp.]|nr:triphosphoribosyl-dephospho-CoA synthase CitG [Eubacteriales bacterium]MDY6067884.1 triphosphoribosyl-dephospho-CoA synthase CitG [Candidatus Faecousia sp.]